MHVYIRIRPAWTFTEVRRAAIALAREVERRRPDLVTTTWWKEERGERVFVDYNQMARDRTIACAYSLRANARATVSHPAHLGRAARRRARTTSTCAPCRSGSPKLGDPHAGIDDAAVRHHPAAGVGRAGRRATGEGDLPYPPDHPKMPGEPKRVQPSRAKRTPDSP